MWNLIRRVASPAGPVGVMALAVAEPTLYVICMATIIVVPDEPKTIEMTIDEITENFAYLDNWDDRYRYVIELGRALPPFPEAARTEANKVQGCASQVWLITEVEPTGAAGPVLRFVGDSDAHIVRGLIAILLALYSGKPARKILDIDALGLFDRLGLRENLTPQRSNGLKSMVGRIRAEARGALVEA
jgi:cysteine desulfuration protein SufE